MSAGVSGRTLKQARAAVLSPSEEVPGPPRPRETKPELGVTAPASPAHPLPLGGHVARRQGQVEGDREAVSPEAGPGPRCHGGR